MRFDSANRVEVGGVSEVIQGIAVLVAVFLVGVIIGGELLAYLIRKGWTNYQSKP